MLQLLVNRMSLAINHQLLIDGLLFMKVVLTAFAFMDPGVRSGMLLLFDFMDPGARSGMLLLFDFMGS